MRILHIVDALTLNGRTMLLQELVRHVDPSFKHIILATLKNSGPLTSRFSELGINAHAFNLYSPMRGIRNKWKAIRSIIRFRPDVCLCWSGDSNLISVVPRIFGIPVVWTIHNSTINWNTAAMRCGVRLSALLSRFVPEKIVCCSYKTYEAYRNIHNYRQDKLLVITNGVDVRKFRPNKENREKVRKALEISCDAIVIATAARIELVGRPSQGDFKDLGTLFKAAAIVCQKKPNIIFMLFGVNLTYDNAQLRGWINEHDLHSNVKLLGLRNDVPELFAASNIYAMSSTTGEGLPISLIEAMAAGVIPVCTDSGDIGKVIGSAGFVVPQGSAAKLAAAILAIAELSKERRAEYSRNAVEIVKKFYSIELTTQRYVDVLAQLVSGKKNDSTSQ